MGRPKKVVTLSAGDRVKRWRKNNPEKAKLDRERQKRNVQMKSEVRNLLFKGMIHKL